MNKRLGNFNTLQHIAGVFRYICSMTLQERIKNISSRLASFGNESAVEKVEELLNELSTVIGYKTDGTPITKANLLDRIDANDQAIKDGDFSLVEDFEKESENW